jgi:hypothetical protein
MRWRFEGGRPVSELADQVMKDVMKTKKQTPKKTKKAERFTEEWVWKMTENSSREPVGSRKDWQFISRYWHRRFMEKWNELGSMRVHIAGTVKGLEIYRMGLNELKTWLDRQTPDSTA